jgi:L-aminopeptidase/D-esterase-like protein
MRAGLVTPSWGKPATVLVAVITDAALDRAACGRVAVMASAGIARAVSPAFTGFDGDLVFALSLGRKRVSPDSVGAAAAVAVAGAILRGVTQAHAGGGLPSAADLR